MNNKIITKVFISYSIEDYEMAKRLYDDLQKTKGVVPWLAEEDLKPGQNRTVTIPRIIEESDYFILLVSKNSITKNGYIQKEQKIALNILDELPPNKIFVIPARIDGTEPLDEKLRNIHWANFFDYRRGLEDIMKSFKSADIKRPQSFWDIFFDKGTQEEIVYVVISEKGKGSESKNGQPTEQPGHSVKVSYNEVSAFLTLQKNVDYLKHNAKIIHSGIELDEKEGNLIIIGSPHANNLCGEIMSGQYLPYKFDSECDQKYISRGSDKFFSLSQPRDKPKKDYGIILRIANPYGGKRSKVLILAGNHGFGTESAVKFVATHEHTKVLDEKIGTEDFEVLFEAHTDNKRGYFPEIIEISILCENKWITI